MSACQLDIVNFAPVSVNPLLINGKGCQEESAHEEVDNAEAGNCELAILPERYNFATQKYYLSQSNLTGENLVVK